MTKFLSIIACLFATGALAAPVQYSATIEHESAGTTVHLLLLDDGVPTKVEVSNTKEYLSECTTHGGAAEGVTDKVSTGMVATIAISAKDNGMKTLQIHLRDDRVEKYTTLPTECGDMLMPQMRTTEATQSVAISDDKTNAVQVGEYRVIVKRVGLDE